MEAVGAFLKANGAVVLLGLTLLVLLQYVRGRKANLRLARAVSDALERALEPLDQKYTWIGGVSGFKAVFDLGQGMEVRVTLAMCPRHAILYLPISWLIFGWDRLLLLVEKRSLAPGEGHLIRKGTRRTPGTWVPSRSGFPLCENAEVDKRTFRLLASDARTMDRLRSCMAELASSGLRHLATLARDPMIYLNADPRSKGLSTLLSWLRSSLKDLRS